MMTLSNFMFLFELAIKDIKSNINSKQFNTKCQFADIFELNLRNPNKLKRKNKKGKVKVRRKTLLEDNLRTVKKVKFEYKKSELIINNIAWLMLNMKRHPLELSLWSKNEPEYKIGSTFIPWSNTYINYLNCLNKKKKEAVSIEGIYNIYDEISSKRLATITLTIKLTAWKNSTTSQLHCDESNPVNIDSQNILNSELKTRIEMNKHCCNGIFKTDSFKNINYTTAKRKGNKNKIKNNAYVATDANKVVRDEGYKDSTYYNIIDNNDIKSKEVTNNSKMDFKTEYNALDYVFADPTTSNKNKVYCIYYFTVESDTKSNPKSNSTSKSLLNEKPSQSLEKLTPQRKRIRLKKCNSDCVNINMESLKNPSTISIDLPQELAEIVRLNKCKNVKCDHKVHRELPAPFDDAILLDLTNLKKECCKQIVEKVEEVVGGVSAQMEFGKDPCFCTCECRFGFTKKTTYCQICGGYEKFGDELVRKPGHQLPHPCPIFHNLAAPVVQPVKGKALKTAEKKSVESDKMSDKRSDKKSDKVSDKNSDKIFDKNKGIKKKDDRFKFNYGYKAPKIGHSHCTTPCRGTLGLVPKHMGWLWNAEDTPGMKFRPSWKPGAATKFIVKKLKIARNPEVEFAKKRRKDVGKKKRPLKRPLLVVHKKDGEYLVTMETMKTFTKPRTINQHPYEDKPVLTYTIGRTEEENLERRKKKERAQRRLERCQREFIQSSFKDMCKDICLKTYQQALGILPDAEDPDCICYPATPTAEKINLDVSCSCSEDKSSIGSATDLDEWIVEFTPPNALFDPTYKGKKVVKADNSTQYTYLDFRVKLVDRFGNPVPRFFKGPEGKLECSDLGGFWSPEHKWQEINVDGYVAPDGKWAPNIFTGPDGDQVDAETGKFQAANGKWLVVGVDGYIDNTGKWRFYQKPREAIPKARFRQNGDKSGKKLEGYKSEGSWSCFGDVSPKQLSRLGIVGHGQDKKLLINTLKDMIARGEDVKLPELSTGYNFPEIQKKGKRQRTAFKARRNYVEDRIKCHHSIPSDKGIIAVDAHGNKTYFRLKEFKNKHPQNRLGALAKQGISLSSFHVPCFRSFINAEVMKKKQLDRLLALGVKNVGVQAT